MEGSEDRRDKKKETKKFLFKKDSKDKGYSTLSADNSQDSVFLVNTKYDSFFFKALLFWFKIIINRIFDS